VAKDKADSLPHASMSTINGYRERVIVALDRFLRYLGSEMSLTAMIDWMAAPRPLT